MKNEIDTLLQKKMDRRAFLKHVGISFVALTGLMAAIKTITSTPIGTTTTSGSAAPRSNGYGSNVYGGKNRNA